jgi:hypothetical protein
LAHYKKKKVETVEALHNRSFNGETDWLSLWPTYIGEKGRSSGKTYGIKSEVLLGTHWEPRELDGNLKETCWEQ